MKYIKSLITAVIVITGILFIVHILGVLVRPEETDNAHDQIETFHSLPQNSIEVVVYGSSHAFRGMNVMEMYRKYGIGAYNYGWNWQRINTTKLFLQDSLLSQKPKVVLIECFYVQEVIEDSDVVPEVYYCRYIKDKKAKRAYMKQCMGKSPTLERRLSYIMPLAMFHDNWSDLTQDNFEIPKQAASEDLRKNMGYLPSDDVVEITIPEYRESVQQELPAESISVLDDMIQICKDNQIEPVFYVVPYEGEYHYSDAMANYAKEHGCVFLDLCKDFQKTGLDGRTDYMDRGHLNDNGAKKVADYVGEYLVTHYALTDFRNVENNLWEDR